MGLKRFLKKARKAVGLPAITLRNAAKVAAVAGTGGLGGAGVALGAKVIRSRLKSAAVGGVKQVIRSKAEKALHDRTAQLIPAGSAASRPKATAMPGGARLAGELRSLVRRRRRRSVAATSAPAATGTKRKAPTGGLDLKALSASWRAAGKPGKWLDWIKSHR
jgi:hypothetical protein